MKFIVPVCFQIEDGGVKGLIKLCTAKSKLHSLNVGSNSIGRFTLILELV